MYKILLLSTVLLICFQSHARQEYIDNGDEKGYAKDGIKVGYWEYYNSKDELQIKINHDNGKLAFLAADSSDYVVNVDGQWIERSFKIYPFRVGSKSSYYRHLGLNVDYPRKARDRGLTGAVYITFEIDKQGLPTNFNIEQDICEGCNINNIEALKEALGVWIPAQENGKIFASRFVQPIIYKLGRLEDGASNPDFPDIMEFNGESFKTFASVVVAGYSSTSVRAFGTRSLAISQNVKKPGLSPTDDHGYKKYTNMECTPADRLYVKYLDLTLHYLRSVPDKLSDFVNLEILNLADNDIEKLSPDIDRLSKLNELFLDRNKLTELPSAMAKLERLSRLSLSGNMFSEFPSVITQMKNLQELDLSSSGITVIPDDISALQQLQKLNISGNNITTLPDSFYSLSGLKELRINLKKLDREERKKLKKELNEVKISK